MEFDLKQRVLKALGNALLLTFLVPFLLHLTASCSRGERHKALCVSYKKGERTNVYKEKIIIDPRWSWMQVLEGGFGPLFTDRVVTWFTRVVYQSSEWLSSIGLI